MYPTITSIEAGYDGTFNIAASERIFAPIIDASNIDTYREHIKLYHSTTVTGEELLYILRLFPVEN